MTTLDYIYFLILIVTTTLAYIFLFRQELVRTVPILLTITLGVNCYAAYLLIIDKINLYLYHFFTPIEYGLLSYLFYSNFASKRLKRFVIISMPIVLLVSMWFAFFIEGIDSNNSYATILCNFFTMIWTLTYLLQMLKSSTEKKFHEDPMCWISIGVLFYSTGNIITIGPLNYLMENNMAVADFVYTVSYFFSFLYFLSIILGSLVPKYYNTAK